MKNLQPTTKKWIIGLTITGIIVLVIIWYRNYKKNKQAELSKSKIIIGGTIPVTSPATDIGKVASVKGSTTFYTTDGNMSIAYVKKVTGEFAGSIVATQTDSGNTSFYKIINSAGTKLYVLKSQVTVK